jgi:hypothetical protein
VWRHASVAIFAARAGGEPGDGGPDECRSSGHEGHYHRTPPRSGDIIPGTRNHLVDPPFGIRGGETGLS